MPCPQFFFLHKQTKRPQQTRKRHWQEMLNVLLAGCLQPPPADVAWWLTIGHGHHGGSWRRGIRPVNTAVLKSSVLSSSLMSLSGSNWKCCTDDMSFAPLGKMNETEPGATLWRHYPDVNNNGGCIDRLLYNSARKSVYPDIFNNSFQS